MRQLYLIQTDIYVCKTQSCKTDVYLFLYSREQTASMTAHVHLSVQVQRWMYKVFKNLTAEDIRDSVEHFEKAIDQAQIIMFPGGFSAGDEPDGSAKFFATAFQNAKIKEAVMKLIK